MRGGGVCNQLSFKELLDELQKAEFEAVFGRGSGGFSFARFGYGAVLLGSQTCFDRLLFTADSGKAERGKEHAPPIIALAFAELDDQRGVFARGIDFPAVITLGEFLFADRDPRAVIRAEGGESGIDVRNDCFAFAFCDLYGVGKTIAVGEKLGGERQECVADGELGCLIFFAIGICADMEAENAGIDGVCVETLEFQRSGEQKNERDEDSGAGDESRGAETARGMCRSFHFNCPSFCDM